jgi:hypothetical protein
MGINFDELKGNVALLAWSEKTTIACPPFVGENGVVASLVEGSARAWNSGLLSWELRAAKLEKLPEVLASFGICGFSARVFAREGGWMRQL